MQKKNVFTFILCLLLIPHLSAHANVASDTFEAVKNSLTTPFAFQIYASVIASVGTHVAVSLADPGLYKLRKATNTLTTQEKQIDIMYQKQLLELQEARFNMIAAQRQMLEEGWASYKKNIQKKIAAVSHSELSEEEKDQQIETLKKKLEQAKLQKQESNNSLFEQMIAQANSEA